MMKATIITILLSILSCLNIFAQNKNIFSKHSSQPEITGKIIQKINEIPFYKPNKTGLKKDLPSHIDNSILKYFPPIFNQLGNSCSQASGIRYIFSYEMNRLRNTDASSNQNVYAYHYTWNFLNDGEDVGSWYFDGYNLVKDNGVPSLNEFNDESGINEKTWMSGYDKYYKSIHNKIASYSKIDAETANGLNLIKQYLVDHGNDSETGGLLNFSGKTSNWEMITYSGSSETNYGYAIKNFGNGGDHAMTIVGYDDSVKVDVNSDNIIQEDEKGALIIVNSWGANWGSNGRAYMPYKLLSKSWWDGGMGNGDHYVYTIEAKDHTPEVVAKININYTSRNDLWLIIGLAESANATFPEKTKTMKIIKKQGGDHFMQGSNTETAKKIEIGLDYTDLIEKIPNAKTFFLTIKKSAEGEIGNGVIEKFSIMDYRKSKTTPVEHVSNQKNVEISSTTKIQLATENTTGIQNIADLQMLNIYPNPVKKGESIFIKLNAISKINKIELISINGKNLNMNYKNENNKIQLNIPSNLNKGIYYLRIFETDKTFFRKIVVI